MNGTQRYIKAKDGVIPKFIGYFTHTEILAAWLKSLGYDMMR